MNYPYANGVISAIENKILDRNKLYVLTKYQKNEFVKVLQAMNYGGKSDTTNISLEELINSENQLVRNFIDEISPDKKATDLFYLVNDALNIKVLYKYKIYKNKIYSNKTLEKNDLLNIGSFKYDDLYKAIIDDDFDISSKSLKGLIININKKITQDISPRLLSTIIDNEVYSFALKETSNSILTSYIKHKIDFNNVIVIFRCKNLKWNKNEFLSMILDNGYIKKETFSEIYDLSKEDISKNLEKYYDGKISKLLNSLDSVDDYQLEFDRLMLDIMKKYKDEPLNIGPIIYYYLLKAAEAQNIRILYTLSLVDIKYLI